MVFPGSLLRAQPGPHRAAWTDATAAELQGHGRQGGPFAGNRSARSRRADEIMVRNHGKVVEPGDSHEVIANPQDEYTHLLLSSIPNPFAGLDVPTVLDPASR